jgi:hypothetical protein
VVFYGTMDAWFKAVNARTGEPLWQFKCGSRIIGQAVTYRGPDGMRYIAILSGVGVWSGAIVSGALDPRDPISCPRLRRRDGRSAAAHDEGRDAVCLFTHVMNVRLRRNLCELCAFARTQVLQSRAILWGGLSQRSKGAKFAKPNLRAKRLLTLFLLLLITCSIPCARHSQARSALTYRLTERRSL